MKTTIHDRMVLGRKNVLKGFILGFFNSIASYPRLILEVFFRRDLGERTYTLMSAITVGIALFEIPFFILRHSGIDWFTTLRMFWGWYVFLAAYGTCSVQRYLEIRRSPGVFDLEKYSYSRGEEAPYFIHLYKLFRVKEYNPRLQGIIFEPLVGILAGLCAYIIGQGPLALLLVTCSIIYCLSIWWSYWFADQLVMDELDNMIQAQETIKSIRNNQPPSKGIPFFPKLPTLQEVRDSLADRFESQEESYAH